MRRIYGLHLIMDGYVAETRALEPQNVVSMFDAVVSVLDMRYLTAPEVARVDLDPVRLASDEAEGGWSIYAQITTSHIAFHGWPLRKAFMMDVFSCKPFDAALAEHVIRKELGVVDANVIRVERADPRRYHPG